MAGTFNKKFSTFGEGIAEMMEQCQSAKDVFAELGTPEEVREAGAVNPLGSGAATDFEKKVVAHLYGRLQMGETSLALSRWGAWYITYNGTVLGWGEDRNGQWRWGFTIRHKDGENISAQSTLRVKLLAAGWTESN